jgi:hypothetical protein
VSRRARWILVVALAALLIAVVVIVLLLMRPPVTTPASTRPAASATPTPAPTPTPTATTAAIAADALVVITATATDTSGARLSLTMVVHKPLGRNDPAAASRLAQLSGQCGSDPNWATQAEPESGIERIDVIAVPAGSGVWPAGSEVSIWATDNNLKVADGTGITASAHYRNDPPLPPCQDQKAIYGPADGSVTALMWARAGFDQPVDSPNIYRWIQQEYGFFGADGPDGPVTIADCSIVVTDAARAYGWEPSLWRESVDQYGCVGTGAFF